MKRFAWIVALAALVSTTAVSAQIAPAEVNTASAKRKPAARSSIQRTSHLYATKEGQQLYLDRIVDTSVKVPGKRPVILFSFGGGWEGGSRNDNNGSNDLYMPYLAMGYTVIAIDYRLGVKIAKDRKEFTPENGTQRYLRAIEWGVEDIFDSTTFVVNHADEWNIDKEQIVLMGGSSGATDSLVAEYNVANETELARNHLPAGFRYAGVISMAGAFWLKANTPLLFKNKPAPILFFHGAKDQLVTYDEVQGPFSGYGPVYYARRFAGPDYPKWFVDYPQGDHIIAAMPAIDSQNEIKSFLQKFVKERQQLSIHTIEEGAIPKIFGNARKLLPAK
jgi:pimeloyl-ACP methyl ester carboxylesterase